MTSSSRMSRVSTAAFARAILEAAGLGALVAVAGCGGNVVVDVGSTDTDTDTTTTNSTTTATYTCNVEPQVYSAEYQCTTFMPAAGCPGKNDPSLIMELISLLGTQGCGGADVASVMCGPDPTNTTQCCYTADAIIYECGGRPFVVDGGPRTAGVATRSDWLAPVDRAAVDLDDVTRLALAYAWTRSALDEHASIASFARFTMELLAVGAPAEIVALAQRALGDEIRHAELCFGLASRYAGSPVGPGSLAIAGGGGGDARHGLAEIAAATVREGCVGETIAAFVASAARAEAEDASVQSALSVIARDESAHAALAFRFVAWALAQGGADVRDAVENAVAASMATPPTPLLLSDIDGAPAALRAHGQLPAATRAALTAQCMAEVIAPSLRAMLRALPAAGESSHARAS